MHIPSFEFEALGILKAMMGDESDQEFLARHLRYAYSRGADDKMRDLREFLGIEEQIDE